MQYLPIFLNIRGQQCLVVGGGTVAVRKVALLRQAGAEVKVIAPKLHEQLQEWADKGKITAQQASFSETEIKSCYLVIAATDDSSLNEQVYHLATAQGVLVNVADCPRFCDFILPSIVDRSPVIVAVSSGGASPVLARLLRARLETLIPQAYGRLGQFAARYRSRIKQRITGIRARRIFWEKVLQGSIAERIFAGQEEEAEGALEAALEGGFVPEQGEVYLVGAGPGDPDLLTFRALRLMQQADVVFHDRLVSPEVLALVRREAERIYVGKKRSWHAVRQEEINMMLVRSAREGKRVLRLKGGDPFIFGRGGEEIATLAAENIPFQVVPGITAASGCASYAGIPLTHRDHAHACIFVTGQLKEGRLSLNWQALVQPQQTIVVYMGLSGLEILCQELIAHGMPAVTPAALVQQGTTSRQRVLTGTLATLPDIVQGEDIHAPTLVIIGGVVALYPQLAWFKVPDREPLDAR
ncbi:precorrin-2 dehydrogenase [Nitrosococcus oceani ATCC 19707]|uniref:Siroheme synthase n=2 Tax=Nitrosococcus oceani TaxID=1229 RepID=CYSG_NITOC|nr:siroheme synthase CysG [Nitrosococcus oceani]Q3JCS0.1 RecName: Full=Siroheme synthase; Includes: RecName: Full=Uroporphyrinogen-III C-methyltransferase; Short=Urogen III methylase; AltName: Full=SUMT; AltName: Full=Uroporphyrinogen III methylase; Short=UROM; Includes: RecName: Full=Precorrin-2 dehydrogenase; Includes: RecName: Full=Sirohydrochlorin ferrochelatase [Nitrosococcus oceani ATCC 19707]ABA57376.1 precorrin-2 dehydrogenase [Nitrosococcus oceani ATCC 19707]EDZ67904.1 uroporphyrin-III 